MKLPKSLASVLMFVLLVGVAGGLGGCAALGGAAGSSQAGDSGKLAGYLMFSGSDTMVNLGKEWAAEFMGDNPGLDIRVTGGGTELGITALIDGTADVADASREPTPDERSAAATQHVELVETAVARDGIAVIVNPRNKVRNLTMSQLAGIYRGRIKNWSQVGGSDAPIIIVGRDRTSGTYRVFKEMVLGPENRYSRLMHDRPNNKAVISEVAANANAIGYVGRGYALGARPKVVVISLDGIQNSTPNVQAGKYPLTRDLYIVTSGRPQDVTKAYVDWILGPEGRAVTRRLGYVPLPR